MTGIVDIIMLDCENYCNDCARTSLYRLHTKWVGSLSYRKHVNCLGQYDVTNPESPLIRQSSSVLDVVSLCTGGQNVEPCFPVGNLNYHRGRN